MVLRLLTFAALLLTSLSVVGQRPKITKATVFTDPEGHALSKEEYKNRLRSKQFAVDGVQSEGAVITVISLKKAGAPDKERLQAVSVRRTFQTPAPGFELTDLNGQVFSLSALRSKVVVVSFWYIKCGYCRLEMPDLKRLAATYKDNPNVVFVSFAPDPPAARRKFLAEQGEFGFAVLPLSKELESKFGVRAYPTLAVIDKEGKYTFDKEGYTDNQVRLEQAIQRALR